MNTEIGGFCEADANDPSALHSTLQDVIDVAWCLPPGKIRNTLLALLSNTNQLNWRVQSARPNVTIT